MKLSEPALLEILADGSFHSGQQLAHTMQVSRTAVWKHLDSLREKGVAIESVRGRGYRLGAPVEMLNAASIQTYLDAEAGACLQSLDIFYQLDSTNQYLQDRPGIPAHGKVVLAEYQTRGRGRGANQWLAAPAAGLCISMGWHFDSAPKTLPALSLATGVVLVDCLAGLGPQTINLKWPNDLLYGGAKLGGILIESRGQLAGEIDVIIGIGINIDMSTALARRIGQRVTDLVQVFGYRPSRNQLAGGIINGMFRMLNNYNRQGFESYIDRWRALDGIRGNDVVLRRAAGEVRGRVVDIDENGFLLMEVNGSTSRYSSGELSLSIKT